MTRRALLSLLAVPFAVACGAPTSEEVSSGPAIMSGSVALTAYRVDNPVVIARGAQGAAFVTPVARSGAFKLVVPASDRYRVILASTRKDGTYQAVSEIRWGAQRAAWGRFAGPGATLDVGTVHPIGSAAAVRTASSGSGSDGESSDSESSSSADSSSTSDSGSSSETESESEDASSADCYKPGKADLPYDVRPGVGATFKLLDAFLEKGAPPKAVLDVTMEGGSWRLAELKSGAPFVVTQADCDHEGNRSTGRDRIFVTWESSDGSRETDHLDMRYCKGGGGGGTATVNAATGECKGDAGSACGDGQTSASECDGGSLRPEDGAAEPLPACSPSGSADGAAEPTGGGSSGGVAEGSESAAGDGAAAPSGGLSPEGGPCVASASCDSSLVCFASTCVSPVR